MKLNTPRSLDEVIASLPAEERARIEARTQELIAEEMSLQEIRRAIGKTQASVAKRLRVGQDAVSKLETRSDMYISTLRNVLRAMGGELDLIVRFPDRPAVRLEELGSINPRRKRRPAA
jgi:DNA-binding transcriptional ArsR family regulator